MSIVTHHLTKNHLRLMILVGCYQKYQLFCSQMAFKVGDY